jgi:hypothetical protein
VAPPVSARIDSSSVMASSFVCLNMAEIFLFEELVSGGAHFS